MFDYPALMSGPVHGDDAMPERPPEAICADAVETFVARYGAR